MIPKIKSQNALKKIAGRLRRKNKRIVFTNGCFDIIHPGHISYLNRARKAGDVLIVGLNSDSSARKLKGKHRPLAPQSKRAEALASLTCVDYVTVFGESTPLLLIKKLRPHILVKGGDWKKQDIVGKDFVESSGGRVMRVPYLKGYSTTGLISSICRKFGK